jgi:penicillin amidase
MKWLKRIAGIVAVLLLALMLVVYGLLRGSLPKLDGNVLANALVAPVSIERDVLGVVTITAGNRVDLAYATGYAHGQDRYFQMDLQRRVAAGELSALIGNGFIDLDKRFRRHNFRQVAREVVAQSSADQKRILAAYVAGVNAAREAMSVRPFEYLLLQTSPAPWTAEDSVLVAYAMYLDLNDSEGSHELERARLHSALPQQVFDLLYPRGTEWDAPMDGFDLSRVIAPLPGADIIDLTKTSSPGETVRGASDADYPGSNNWAVAGRRTANGGAIVANDMHLSLRLAHIWYRTRLIVKSEDAAAARDLTGVTLPGLPLLIAGSNGRIAWGYTNSHGDFDDLVVIDTDAAHPNQYRNGDEYLNFGMRRERIEVRGAPAVEVEYRDTIWGPLIDADLDGKPLALSWTAHFASATSLRQFQLESASTVGEALDIANTAGIPVQNFVVADAQGHIGWTPIGQIPKRVGFDGRLPVCWGCEKNVGWQGWVAPQDYPRIVDPYTGQLWSANSRTLGGPQMGQGVDLIGDEGMDRGARTKQIRDDLTALNKATPQDMLKVQLDDRAVFLKRWRDVLVRMQDEAYLRGHSDRRAAIKVVQDWSGRASVDDAGYRIVRAFRSAIQEKFYRDLTAAARARYPQATFQPSARFEDTAWRIMTLQPENFLDPKYERWDLLVMGSFDRALAQLKKECGIITDKDWSECTWGKRNTLTMEHPLAGALPVVGRLLRMPSTQLPGDNDMPRVQGKSFGASERFAVSPGHEAEGYFHMPGGQSGHPLSPYFAAGHEAWVNGEPTPFLPGIAEHSLTLSPKLSR